MPTKINKHFFHEFYSSNYDSPLSTNKFWNRNPIHITRSIFGAKDPFIEDSKIQVFDSEEKAVEWYKKSKYDKETFNKIESKGKFCKNYFVIPEIEFIKYKNYFNQMIKGVQINSEVEISEEGTACVSCSEYKTNGKPVENIGETSETLTFNNPYGSSYYSVNGGADDIGYMNGEQITEGELGGGFNIDEGNQASSLSFYAKDTVGVNVGVSATVTWYKPIDYKQKFKYTSEINTTKIFDIDNLQKRIGAHTLNYYTLSNLIDDENNEELQFKGSKIFENNWKFNEKNFKALFQNKKKFNENSTLINDPVLLFLSSEYDSKYSLSTTYYNNFQSSDELSDKEKFNKQKSFTKEFSNLGKMNFLLENDNSIYSFCSELFNFEISDIIYLKSKKIYLCFVEINHEVRFNGKIMHPNEQCPDGKYMTIGSTNLSNSFYIFSTNDAIQNEDYYGYPYSNSDCDTDTSKKYEFEIDKFNLIIGDKNYTIESQKIKQTSFSWDNSNCTDLPKINQLNKSKTSFNISKKPSILIIDWKKEDFDKNNIFPPKI